MITSFANLWEGVARIARDRAAVVMGDRSLSWTEFDATSNRVARGLAAVGVTRGTCVAVMGRNSPEYAVALFAAMKLGATPVNVNFRYTAAELVYLLDDCAAGALVCDADLLDVAVAARGLAKNPVVTIAIGMGADDSADAIPFDLLGADVAATESETSGDDVVLLYTGGTTGTPKGVIWSHRSLFETITFNAYTAFGLAVPSTDAEVVSAAEQALEAQISPVSLLASPLTHATALFMAISTWLLGGTVVFLAGRRYAPDELAAAIEKRRVTQLVIVGDVFGRPLADALDVASNRGEPYDLSSLRLIASAGVVWSSSTKQRLAAHGSVTLIDVLGASEGGPYALSVVPPGVVPDSTRFMLGERAALLTDQGELVRAGDEVTGLLAASGPTPVGYLNDPERSAATFRTLDGQRWSVPGDRAVLHADGSITLLGRGSLVINTGGEKVYPEEVERALLDDENIRDAAVVGIPDESWGEVVAGAIVVRGAVDLDGLRQKLAKTLAGYKIPKMFVTVDEIPRSPVGKVNYPLVKAMVDRVNH